MTNTIAGGGTAGKRRAFGLLAAVFLVWPVTASGQSPEAAPEICAQANGIARELAGITGMKLRREVPCGLITRQEINAYLKERIRKEVRPEELRAQELSLKKLGLVPPDFDLVKTTVDLLTEQAAAFYDYDQKKLFINQDIPDATQEPVLAHELAHALADQNYNLAKYIRDGRKDDDASAARLAAMEGQATWLMTEYLARRMGQSLRKLPALAGMMGAVGAGAATQYPVFGSAPLYIRESLLFPYTQGTLFQNALLTRDGDAAFGEVYTTPPVSSQQILHPEKYFARVEPKHPALPAEHLRGYKKIAENALGELEHRVLIEQAAGPERAQALAPHWRGAAYALMENRGEGRVVLLYAVEWDSEDAARQYFAVYREALRKKWRTLEISSETATTVTGTGDDGRFELRREGAVVRSVEGLDPGVN